MTGEEKKELWIKIELLIDSQTAINNYLALGFMLNLLKMPFDKAIQRLKFVEQVEAGAYYLAIKNIEIFYYKGQWQRDPSWMAHFYFSVSRSIFVDGSYNHNHTNETAFSLCLPQTLSESEYREYSNPQNTKKDTLNLIRQDRKSLCKILQKLLKI